MIARHFLDDRANPRAAIRRLDDVDIRLPTKIDVIRVRHPGTRDTHAHNQCPHAASLVVSQPPAQPHEAVLCHLDAVRPPVRYAIRSFALLLALAAPADARPVVLAAGGELGGWTNIEWDGATLELDVPVTDTLSARLSGRWQHLDDEVDECGLDFAGRQLDAIAGVRWDPHAWDHSGIARPFLAAGAGTGRERTHNTCPGEAKYTFTTTATIIEASGGADLSISPRVALRIETRVTLGNFRDGGPADTVTNQEISAGLLLALRL